MKKINIITLLLGAFMMIVSCQKSDFVEPVSLSKGFGLYASFMDPSNGGVNINPTYAQTSELIGVKDLSRGAISHQWSFYYGEVDAATGDLEWVEMKDGISFIKDNSPLGYDVIEDYSPYVDSSVAPTNDLSSIAFIFEKGGRYKFKVRNIYDKQVRYMYTQLDPIDGMTDVNEYIDAVDLGNGEYEIVREYEFMVFDRFKPAFVAYRDPECTELIDMTPTTTFNDVEVAEVTLNVGESITLADVTGIDEDGVSTLYSLPSSRTWTWSCVEGNNNAAPEEVPTVEPALAYGKYQDFIFDEAGTYTVNLYVVRNKPDYYVSNHYPTVGATETLPLIVHVVDPTEGPTVTPL